MNADKENAGVPLSRHHKVEAAPEGKDVSGKGDFDAKRDVLSVDDKNKKGNTPPHREGLHDDHDEQTKGDAPKAESVGPVDKSKGDVTKGTAREQEVAARREAVK